MELGWIIIKDIITPPVFLLDINELLDVFGMFLLVLIWVELLETVKMYLTKKTVHVEVVFTVAMIAIARKVIILDVKELSSLTLMGIGVIYYRPLSRILAFNEKAERLMQDHAFLSELSR